MSETKRPHEVAYRRHNTLTSWWFMNTTRFGGSYYLFSILERLVVNAFHIILIFFRLQMSTNDCFHDWSWYSIFNSSGKPTGLSVAVHAGDLQTTRFLANSEVYSRNIEHSPVPVQLAFSSPTRILQSNSHSPVQLAFSSSTRILQFLAFSSSTRILQFNSHSPVQLAFSSPTSAFSSSIRILQFNSHSPVQLAFSSPTRILQFNLTFSSSTRILQFNSHSPIQLAFSSSNSHSPVQLAFSNSNSHWTPVQTRELLQFNSHSPVKLIILQFKFRILLGINMHLTYLQHCDSLNIPPRNESIPSPIRYIIYRRRNGDCVIVIFTFIFPCKLPWIGYCKIASEFGSELWNNKRFY